MTVRMENGDKGRVYTCTRRIQFCAGHRVYGHESKCNNLHGHNYVAYVTVSASELDHVGRVVDFSVLKEVVGGWIDRVWDHGLILLASDPYADLFKERDQKLFLMAQNPTAENMAEVLRFQSQMMLDPYQLRVEKVLLWETENCMAEAVRMDR